ncbi:penicillin-binding protein 1C [Gammaproteobacteria bacterium 45_16_T64]|nr:penicillin-binding protein 1C [Gammaproteobacteria bacterium 45_16_T64]
MTPRIISRVLLVGLCAVSCGLILWYALCPKPELRSFTTYSTALFDKRGELLRITLAEDDRYRVYEPIDNISEAFVAATIMYEDQSYYDHAGVDIVAIFRAFWVTYILGERRMGASTIVMQVARLRWGIASSSLAGKIQQIFRALQLTRHFSKQEILELYFNLAPYGGNIEGIGAASLIYFDKPASALSFPEALTLAVIPQNPNKRNPAIKRGYAALKVARNNLYRRWVEENPQAVSKQKHMAMPLQVRALSALPFRAPHFSNYMLASQSRWAHGKLTTTLDGRIQKTFEKVTHAYLASKSALGMHNASALLLNYQTMEVEAMVGSADFFNNDIQGQVNGTLAKRSPGSTLKPFVYGLAIDEGIIHPMSLLKDSPKKFGGFTPENYDKQFRGPIVAKDALIESRNVPAVWLQAQLSHQSFYDFLLSAGVRGLADESFYGLALALGGGELTMMELASLYASLANLGVVKPIVSVKRTQSDVSAKGKRILSPEASFLVLDMLKGNASPHDLRSGLSLLEADDIPWKTGTSWAFRDAWAVGVSGPYVLVVWVGNFDGRGNPAFVGRSAAGPLLFSLFDVIDKADTWKVESLLSERNLNLKKVAVCRNTGDLLEKRCPSSVESWFIPGVSPIKSSNVYRSVILDKVTGLRTCGPTTQQTVERIFEFWPSDFLRIFSQAGISLKTPPSYVPGCSLEQKSTSGQKPTITSPQQRVDYVIQSDSAGEEMIPFTATVDSDVESLFWFVNGKYVGQAKSSEAFYWQATNGDFVVNAVDDAGRSATKNVRVLQF